MNKKIENQHTEGSYLEGKVDAEKFVGRDQHVQHGLSGEEVSQVIDTLMEYFTKEDLKPEQFNQTLENINQFREYHEKLFEWKELHDRLDELLSTVDPFVKPMERYETMRRIPKPKELRSLWRPVAHRVDLLLDLAEEIDHIGVPFQINEDGNYEGEPWAVRLQKLRQSICSRLGMKETDSDVISEDSIDFPTKKECLMFRYLKVEVSWWRELYELVQEFRHVARFQMHIADKKLRQVATELYQLSNMIWGQTV